jgi:hypothetical protein
VRILLTWRTRVVCPLDELPLLRLNSLICSVFSVTVPIFAKRFHRPSTSLSVTVVCIGQESRLGREGNDLPVELLLTGGIFQDL